MEYKLPIFLGVIAIILYFDFGRGPREQFFQFIATSTKGLPASKESVLSNNYHEFFKDRKPWAKNAFIGFNGNVDVILNGKEITLYNIGVQLHLKIVFKSSLLLNICFVHK